MATRDDEGAPVVYVPSPSGGARRRDPKKLQNIGISQFKRQGVAHHFNPDSAAAILGAKKHEQRHGEWLGHKATKSSADGSKANAGSKGGVKGGEEEPLARAATPILAREASVQCTTPGSGAVAPTANMQSPQQEAADASGKQVQQESTVSTASEASTQKYRPNGRILGAARRLKPSAGAWGRTLMDNAKEAAPYTTSESYATITTITRVGDTTHIRTVLPPPKQPESAQSYDHDPVQPTRGPAKAARKDSAKKRSSKKDKAPMWSDSEDDDDDGDHEDIHDLLFSSRTDKLHVPKAVDQTTTHTSSSAKRPPILRKKKNDQSQPSPQKKKKRNVRFASPTSSPDLTKVKVRTPFPQHGDDWNFAGKSNSEYAANRAATTDASRYGFDNSRMDSASPSRAQENLDRDGGRDADGEASESCPELINMNTDPITTKSTPTPPTATTNSMPARKKGVAGPRQPKRPRGAPRISNEAEAVDDTEVPLSKKFKMSDFVQDPAGERKASSPVKEDFERRASPVPAPRPFRKKGVASKPVQKKTRPKW